MVGYKSSTAGISSVQICYSRAFYCKFLLVKTHSFKEDGLRPVLSQVICLTGNRQAGHGIKFPKFQRTVEKEVPRFAMNVLYHFRKVSTLFVSVLIE